MIQVTRKDHKEGVENLIRRFNRKFQQAGVLTVTKDNEFFRKPMSKRDRREKAIIRKVRKAEKMKRIRLGQQK
jgi:ribosomal protein S21